LEAVEGVGPRIAESIAAWFNRPANQALIEKFRRAGVTLRVERSTQNSPISQVLAGLSFVITGTLPTWSREEAKVFIEQHGGKVVDSVSKKIGYLVVGEKAGSKLDKAKALGVAILDEAGLRKLVE
ncbi:MAG TPA: BRCT domain-containing protein, partial [Anaerolineae bacterium]|nr:BRCT domain-containing protein [Anaerolineae bacterium]